MPLLVRKKPVSADCACADALAATDMAATAKHAGKIIRAKLFIEVSLLFLWTVCHQPTTARIIPVPDQELRTASGTSGSCRRPGTRQRKRRRGTNRSALRRHVVA